MRKRREINEDPDLKIVFKRMAENIRRIRKKKGISQHMLAADAELALTTLTDIEKVAITKKESDKVIFNIRLQTILAIARALDEDFIDLLK